jgi:FkbM family methyltransferase
MPVSFVPPQYWGDSIPLHWREGCLFAWQYDGKFAIDSQCGQDIVVELLCKSDSNRLYLDLGANDGVNASSTYRLEKNGWRGMLVEPNINLIPSLLSHRANSTILACAVGAERGTLTLQTSDIHTLGTLVDDSNSYQIKRLQAESGGNEKIKKLPVPVMTTADVINSFYTTYHSNPDFLKIDVEGFESQVIEDLFRNSCRPPIIEIENNLRESNVAKMLLKQGYSLQVVMDSFVEIWSLSSCNKDSIAKSLS